MWIGLFLHFSVLIELKQEANNYRKISAMTIGMYEEKC